MGWALIFEQTEKSLGLVEDSRLDNVIVNDGYYW